MPLAVHHCGTPRGPKLFLIHGWALNWRVFEPLMARWSSRYCIAAVDLPGHGASPWKTGPATIASWTEQIAEVAPDTAVVVGWSLGAMLALELARTRPSTVKRLILIAATPRFLRSETWPLGASPESVDRLAALLHDNFRRMVNDFLELQVRGSRNADITLAQLKRSSSPAKPNLIALEAGLDLLRTTDLTPTLNAIEQRTLIIAGQLDRIVPPAASERLAAFMPQARAETIRRAAHAPFLSHIEEFAALTEPFIAAARPTA